MPRNESGLIDGSDAALLIDAGINGTFAAQLQALAAKDRGDAHEKDIQGRSSRASRAMR